EAAYGREEQYETGRMVVRVVEIRADLPVLLRINQRFVDSEVIAGRKFQRRRAGVEDLARQQRIRHLRAGHFEVVDKLDLGQPVEFRRLVDVDRLRLRAEDAARAASEARAGRPEAGEPDNLAGALDADI